MRENCPVVFIIFNRPHVTQAVFERIRTARPNRLFIIADGPRPDRNGESDRVAATRRITERVDWPCDVHREYSDVNLGCRRRVVSGISIAFEHVDRAIVLEDDCLPDRSFFGFAQELLDRFAEDRRVLSIRGDNYQRGRTIGTGSYYASKYVTCWGWATWRRSWEHFDSSMQNWPAARESGVVDELCHLDSERNYWRKVFDDTYSGKLNSWAFAWMFNSFMHRGVHITPNRNLIRNIGFTDDATHTLGKAPRWVPRHTSNIGRIQHPSAIEVCREADRREFLWTHLNEEPDWYRRHFGMNLARRAGSRLRTIVNNTVRKYSATRLSV